jgi:protein SCO1/2
MSAEAPGFPQRESAASPPARRSIMAPLALCIALAVLVVVAIQRARAPGADDAQAEAESRGGVLATFGPIADFKLVDERGKTITKQDLLGRIWVADFFFTTCPGPCLALTAKMRALNAAVAAMPDVDLVSVTVDPETDTPETLLRYAQVQGGDDPRWHWLTGPREELLKLAKSCLTNFGSKEAGGNVNHQTYLYVVDRAGTVRAVHDTQSDEGWKAAVLHSVQLLHAEAPASPPK